MIGLTEEKRLEINRKHIENGVRFIDEKNAYIDEQVVIGKGTVIYPSVVIEGTAVIGENCIIGMCSRIADSRIGDGTEVWHSVITESSVGEDTKVGPFAYIRPGSSVGNRCKVGDFVEIKNSSFGDGSKASHLTYIGDSDVGKDVNLGCGVVFVNYDGSRKYRSNVGDGAFVGCNSNLVSPVNIGDRAYIAAGSTVVSDVPEGSLYIARERNPYIRENWVAEKGILDKKKK